MIYSNDSSFVFSTKSKVASCGCYILTALTAQEAKLRINLYPPHIILIDYNSDKEFRELVWNTKKINKIPTLLCTDSSDYAVAQELSRKKNSGVISKPIDIKTLDGKIKMLINKAKTEFPLYIKFEKDKIQKTQFRMTGKITELSEAGFSMESGIRFFEPTMVKLRSRFFINVGFEPPFSLIMPKDHLKFGLSEASFVGLKEEEAMLIRGWINKRLTRKGMD